MLQHISSLPFVLSIPTLVAAFRRSSINTRQTANDAESRFVIDGLTTGTYAVQASFLGYETVTKTDIVVQTSRPTLLLFELQQTPIEVEGVVVKASAFDQAADAPTSVNTLRAEEIRRTPGGQNDISRSLLSLPGVTGGVDNRNDLLVRGGGSGENAYYLDGIKIPQINHFATQGATGGALGLVNVDFIQIFPVTHSSWRCGASSTPQSHNINLYARLRIPVHTGASKSGLYHPNRCSGVRTRCNLRRDVQTSQIFPQEDSFLRKRGHEAVVVAT